MTVSSEGHPGTGAPDRSAESGDSAGADPGSGSGEEPSSDQTTGLLGRVAAFFSGGSDEAASQDRTNGAVASRSGVPGLGNLRRMRVEDVAIPRVEITAVPADIDRDGLYTVFKESGNTRLPVYEGTLDQPIGLIHLKDFALTYGFNGANPEEFDVHTLLRPLLYAPPSMPIGVLLQKMQTDRSHMALVIDEYGGVDGLVTIEDLIEQVIGEIEDEHDEVEAAAWTEEKPGCYLALARTPLDEFEQAIGLSLAGDEAGEEIDTLGGLVFMEIGRVPTRGEVIPHPSGVQFEVVDADPRRIKRLRVRLPGAAGPDIRTLPRAPSAARTPPPRMETAASAGGAGPDSAAG